MVEIDSSIPGFEKIQRLDKILFMAKKKKPAKPAIEIETTKSTKSVLDKHEKQLLGLITGKKPKNKTEEMIQKEIEEIGKAGRIIDIPFN